MGKEFFFVFVMKIKFSEQESININYFQEI